MGGKGGPWAWWVQGNGARANHWPGGDRGGCACGLQGQCFNRSLTCNCDSEHNDWLRDAGEVTSMEELPVRAVHFGDTGTPLDSKEGRFSLGPLRCLAKPLPPSWPALEVEVPSPIARVWHTLALEYSRLGVEMVVDRRV